MADPDRFDADLDPTFHADADPAPNPDPKYFLARANKKICHPKRNINVTENGNEPIN